MSLDGLDMIPRIGEDIYFIRGENYSGYYFKVESILYEIENGIHKVFTDSNGDK